MSLEQYKDSIFWKEIKLPFNNDLHNIVHIQEVVMDNNYHSRAIPIKYTSPIIERKEGCVWVLFSFHTEYYPDMPDSSKEIIRKDKNTWKVIMRELASDNKVIFDIRSLKARGKNLLGMFEPILQNWKIPVLESTVHSSDIFLLKQAPYSSKDAKCKPLKTYKNLYIYADKDTIRRKDDVLTVMMSYFSHIGTLCMNDPPENICYIPNLHKVNMNANPDYAKKNKFSGDEKLCIRIFDTKLKMNVVDADIMEQFL